MFWLYIVTGQRIYKPKLANQAFLLRWWLYHWPGREKPPGAREGLACPPRPHRPKCSKTKKKLELEDGVQRDRFYLSLYSPTNHHSISVTYLSIKTSPTHNSAVTLNQFNCSLHTCTQNSDSFKGNHATLLNEANKKQQLQLRLCLQIYSVFSPLFLQPITSSMVKALSLSH